MQKLRKLTGNYACIVCGAIMPESDCQTHSWANGSNSSSGLFASTTRVTPRVALSSRVYGLYTDHGEGIMENQPSTLGYEREWERRRELQEAVLLHLTENGSAKWGRLYGHFSQDGTDEIGEALESLTQRRHIAVEADGTAKITPLGTKHLKDGS
jgi:hypothetical protein